MGGPRNILIFSDGTGNSSGRVFKTNVWRLYKAVDLADPTQPAEPRQFAYYHDGVGTSSFKPYAILGGAFGFGLARNVRDAYAFLCRTYRPGDRIFVFGFSRGAFTARVLTALILDQGIIPYDGSEAALKNDVERAYRNHRRTRYFRYLQPHVLLYRATRDRLLDFRDRLFLGKDFKPYDKSNNIHRVDGKEFTISFVGVWDTVAAYGLPIDELTKAIDIFVWPLSMPDHDLHPRVDRARHALSLDEERNTFHPQLWNEGPPRRGGGPAPNPVPRPATVSEERLSQVWFAGVHSDVGGGYPDDALSYVSLQWMMAEAERSGIRFCAPICADYASLGDENGVAHDSRRGLAGYYRYNPRRIERLTSSADVEIERVKVHESALRRIKVGQDGYAPIVLPPNFEVAKIDGSIVRGDAYVGAPLDPASAYATERECVFDWVWWRRVAYFATLTFTLGLVVAPLYRPPLPKGACESAACFVTEWITVLSYVLPGFASVWIDTFASHPLLLIVLAGLVGIGLFAGAWLDGRIRDDMRRIWYGIPATVPDIPNRSFQGAVAPSPVNRAVQSLRTRRSYRLIRRALTQAVMPTAFLTLVLYGSAVLVGRLAFTIQDSAGLVCRSIGSEARAAPGSEGVEFKTDALCEATGYRLRKGGTYRVRFAVPKADPWLDRELRAGPNGIHPNDQPPWMAVFVPLRRRLTQPWFMPMARVGSVGTDDYPLDPLPSLPERATAADPADTVFESEIVARSSGELFLYVNDAVFPPVGTARFYGNNHGSARVSVREVTERP